MDEIKRKMLHLCAVAMAALSLILLGRVNSIALMLVVLIIGSLIINQKIMGKRIIIIDEFLKKFERKNIRFLGYGSAWLVIGVLYSLLFLGNTRDILSVLVVLGFGDGMSTIAGIKIKSPKIFYNRNKSIAGMVAMFLFSLLSFAFIGERALLLAVVGALVESLPLPLDDNITIPISASILFGLMV